MVDNNTRQRSRVDFSDTELVPSRFSSRADVMNKEVSSLNRKLVRSKRHNDGYRVTNSLGGSGYVSHEQGIACAITNRTRDIIPPKSSPVRILVQDRGARQKAEPERSPSTSRTRNAMLETTDTAQEALEIELKRVLLLNQATLKPIEPLGKCILSITRSMDVTVVSQNKQVRCFDFNLDSDVKSIYFRREKDILTGEFVVLLNQKSQMTKKDLNLLNPNIIYPNMLPKFDKIWFYAHKSTDFSSFHSAVSQTGLKIYHQTLADMSDLFLNSTTTANFYGTAPTSTFLRARRERLETGSGRDEEETTRDVDLISTGPRTRAVAAKQASSSPDSRLRDLVTKLDDEEHETIREEDQIRFTPNLNYKFQDKRTLTITNADFKCLYDNNWINDTLIDFFLKLECETAIKQGKVAKDEIALFNSFFFTKMTSSERHYENVKNWFKDEKLFTNRYVIIPVNQDFHWYCLIIHNLDKFYMRNESVSEEGEQEFIEIFILDSLSQQHRNIRGPMTTFFIDYAKDKYGVELSANKFKTYLSPIPKQTNFNDCGIHVIYNIGIFLNNIDTFKEIWKKTRRSYKNQNSLFKLAERQGLRRKFRDVLIAALRQQEKGKGVENVDEKIGKLTNKEYLQNLASDKDSNDNDAGEADDSDFEIIEDNTANGARTPDAVETESGSKVTHFTTLLKSMIYGKSPENSDASPIQQTQGTESIDRFDFEDFYIELNQGPEAPVGDYGALTSSKKAEVLGGRLVQYLSRFDTGVLEKDIYRVDLTNAIKYFNGVENNGLPDKRVMRRFFDAFKCDLEGISKEDAEESDESMVSTQEDITVEKANLDEQDRGIGSQLTKLSSSVEEIEMKDEPVSISDDENESMKSAVTKNRETFMSKFFWPNSRRAATGTESDESNDTPSSPLSELKKRAERSKLELLDRTGYSSRKSPDGNHASSRPKKQKTQ